MCARIVASRPKRSHGRTLAALLSIHLFVVGVPTHAQAQNDAGKAQTSDATQPPSESRQTQEQVAQDDRSLRAAEPAIRAQEKRIQEDLAALPQSDLPEGHWAHDWAGEYYVGDGLGMNVRIHVAPEAGITYTWHGCLGLYDGNYGEITGSFDLDADGRADGLTIDWALHKATGFAYDSKTFYFVRWKGPDGKPGRRYLVPESKMLEVVNDYNAGGFARDGMYSAPLKRDTAEPGWRASRSAVEGVPQLPAKWSKLLLLKPVDAVVTSVSPITTGNVTIGVDVTRARVFLDKGSADGLYLGLTINLPDAPFVASLTIDKLQEHSAECEFRAFTGADRPAAPPQVGETIRVIQGAG